MGLSLARLSATFCKTLRRLKWYILSWRFLAVFGFLWASLGLSLAHLRTSLLAVAEFRRDLAEILPRTCREPSKNPHLAVFGPSKRLIASGLKWYILFGLWLPLASFFLLQKIGQHSVTGLAAKDWPAFSSHDSLQKKWPAFRHRICCHKIGQHSGTGSSNDPRMTFE